MTTNQPLDVLLAHDRWASDLLLAACEPLGDADLDRPFEMGRGSLRKTLVHMLQVVDGWDAGINGWATDASIAEGASIAVLRAAHGRVYDAFARTCVAGPADEVLTLRRGNVTMRAPRGAVLTHVLTHGTHHRAQAMNMLRHLGVQPLPKSSVVEWMLATSVAMLG